MAWIEPLFEKPSINAAGRCLVQCMNDDAFFEANTDQYLESLEVINNFRGAHAYPLNTFQVYLRKTSKRFDVHALVAQRIKRLYSIYHKLDRQKRMKLTQMQDLGGCRAILSSVASVRKVVSYYREESSIKHTLVSCDDYILEPKESGYRGVHLVYRYQSDKQKKVYNDLKIEIQIRSRYQHAWATAVETVSMFSGQALKSSLGNEEWQRFFSLMGSAIALRENTPIVPTTPTSKIALISELSALATRLQVEHRLAEYSKAMHSMTQARAGAFYYLMQLDANTKRLSVVSFSEREKELANVRYSEAEQSAKGKQGMDAVLVSVESVGALTKAYPNYFADTRVFLNLLRQAIEGRTRSIRVPELRFTQGTLFDDGN